MLLGFTEIDAVGAAGAGAGGGGGGGGAAFFAQAPSVIRAPSATISRNHFMFCCFTLFLLAAPNDRGQTKCVYFQLQFGCVLRPVKVNCCSLLPSASIVQISSLPDRLD